MLAEGDLIYFSKTKSVFEIKMVEFQNPFYQLGKIYVFRLRCELFDYGSEVLDTGVTDLDAIEDSNSLDMLQFQFTLENGDKLQLEDRSSLILESYATQKSNANTDNADFDVFQRQDDIVDFTEINPFGELR